VCGGRGRWGTGGRRWCPVCSGGVNSSTQPKLCRHQLNAIHSITVRKFKQCKGMGWCMPWSPCTVCNEYALVTRHNKRKSFLWHVVVVGETDRNSQAWGGSGRPPTRPRRPRGVWAAHPRTQVCRTRNGHKLTVSEPKKKVEGKRSSGRGTRSRLKRPPQRSTYRSPNWWWNVFANMPRHTGNRRWVCVWNAANVTACTRHQSFSRPGGYTTTYTQIQQSEIRSPNAVTSLASGIHWSLVGAV